MYPDTTEIKVGVSGYVSWCLVYHDSGALVNCCSHNNIALDPQFDVEIPALAVTNVL